MASSKSVGREQLRMLSYNCTECRDARTKCDRNSPICRRCNRLGLVCLSTKPYTATAPIINAAQPLSAIANVIKSVVVRFKEKEDMKQVFMAYIRWWMWMALERESENLLSHSILLGKTIRMPFCYYKDVFAKTYSKTAAKGNNNINSGDDEKDHWMNNVYSPMVKAFSNEMNSNYTLTRASFEGQTFWWTGSEMARSYISGEEANKTFKENKRNIITSIFSSNHDRMRFIAAISQEISSFIEIKFQFKKSSNILENAYKSTLTLRNIKVKDRGGMLFQTNVNVRKVLAQNGDFLVETISFVGGVTSVNGHDNNEELNAKKRKKENRKKSSVKKKKKTDVDSFEDMVDGVGISSAYSNNNDNNDVFEFNNGYNIDDFNFKFDLGDLGDVGDETNELLFKLFSDED